MTWTRVGPQISFQITGGSGGGSGSGGNNGGGNTALQPPPGYASSQIIFDDAFQGTTLDASKWVPYLGSKAWPHWYPNCDDGSSQDESSAADYDLASQLAVDNGLTITAVRGSNCGNWTWTSGALSTYGLFDFTGGYVQVSMQQPATGDGMWPAIWMLPGANADVTTDNFEIDIEEGGATGNNVSPDYNEAWHLHAGPGVQYGTASNVNVDLSAGFHTYGMEWIPSQQITWYLDGQQIGQVTSNDMQIPDEPMELILGLSVGTDQIGDWHSTVDDSTVSPSLMHVAEVQVYSH